MPTSTQRSPRPAAAARVKGADKKTSPPAKPFLRFYYSASLCERTLSVLGALEKAKDKKQHRNALADIVVELTGSGMDYFFLRPLKLAGAGFVTQQSANLGLAATTSVMATVIRNIIGGMDDPQLLSVSRTIRQLMK